MLTSLNPPFRSVYTPSPFQMHPFHWWECGQGTETVVFLHGIMAHAMAFRLAVSPLAARFRVIVADLPAHGRDQTFRSPDDIPPTVQGLSRWLDALLASIGDSRVHLVGHSLGATLGFHRALRADRAPLQSLTLISPGLKLRTPRQAAGLIKRLPSPLAQLGMNRLGIRLLEPLQWRRARMTTDELDAYLEPLKHPARLDFMLRLAADLVAAGDRSQGAEHIALPTLLIWGDRDHLLPLETAHRLERAIPRASLHVFNACGHCPMEDYPDDFNRLLADFLALHAHP
ncbi:hypothetical protein DL240_00850 [Lujinxingia litoralis]|uniref:AB hydrolase-1 domain-containing protein n=1 Tax=Lujinxingia litoralis TaxID=2211119 RepID=A0A328CC90_9DELT|nr:alpha/beta hydrolase [Lujinxingia litoralis]RAL24791.1 hypothetical protein DL240_00850 [Lujinxingia litoralis]